MRIIRVLFIATFLITNIGHAAEPCQTIHGRANFYPADGQVFIWHIGTHHLFWLQDEKSQGLLFKYIPTYEEYKKQPKELFGDFDVCPTEPYKSGAAQTAILQRIQRARLVAIP